MDFIEIKKIPRCSTKFIINTHLEEKNIFVFSRELEDPKIFVISGMPPLYHNGKDVLCIGVGDKEEEIYIPKKYQEKIFEAIKIINEEMK